MATVAKITRPCKLLRHTYTGALKTHNDGKTIMFKQRHSLCEYHSEEHGTHTPVYEEDWDSRCCTLSSRGTNITTTTIDDWSQPSHAAIYQTMERPVASAMALGLINC